MINNQSKVFRMYLYNDTTSTYKSNIDIYSYGAMIYEILTNKKNISLFRQVYWTN